MMGGDVEGGVGEETREDVVLVIVDVVVNNDIG